MCVDRAHDHLDRDPGASLQRHRKRSTLDPSAGTTNVRDGSSIEEGACVDAVAAPAGPDVPARLGLLGGFYLRVAAQDVDVPLSAQRLVCFLALQRQPLLRDFVGGALYGDSTQHRAEGSLRSALWRLPHADVLVALTPEHIALSPAVTVDYREGEALAHRVLDPNQELDDVAMLNDEVLSGDLLPDWTEDWVLMDRERYHQLRLRALEALCRRLTALGRHGQAVQAGLAAVAGEPLRESARRALIEAHLAEHNVAAAHHEYDAFRELLQAELGLTPSDDLRGLLAGSG
jgi:DNA-binding SARP family transcriptional activator